MSNKKLSDSAVLEIQKAMIGLNDKASAYLAKKLAEKYGFHKSRIYEVTKEYRPKRKSRVDKGRRKAKETDKDFLDFAAKFVKLEKMKPEDAYKKAQENGFRVSVSPATFKRYLQEEGLWISEKPLKATKVEKYQPVIIVLDDDAAKVFDDSESVNNALRGLIPIIQARAKNFVSEDK